MIYHTDMSSPLGKWVEKQPRGAMMRLLNETKLSWSTVCRARRGDKVGVKAAVLLSRATAGVVKARDLTDERDALEALAAWRP